MRVGNSIERPTKHTEKAQWARRRLLAVAIVAGLATLASASTDQRDWAVAASVKPADVQMGSLLLRTDTDTDIERGYVPAPTVATKVRIGVTGLIGRTRVAQTFRNPSSEWVEGVYVFPLPERSAVDTLRMVVGERIIEGQIQERQKARRTYEQAKAAGKRTSLLEQERPNIFTMSVAHIGPHEEVRVELEYQQDIRYQAGRFDLRFPMVVGPRYIPGKPRTERVAFAGNGWAMATDVVPDAGRITPPVLHPSAVHEHERENPVDIEVELGLGMLLASIDSGSHPIRVEREAGFRYRVAVSETPTPADRDFTLTWKPEVGAAPRAALFTESLDGNDYVLLMLLPPDVEPGVDAAATRLPRETIFVIDTSGSMNGTSIDQARRALLIALDRLVPEDSFNVIQFNSSTSALFDRPVPADRIAIDQARAYVAGLGANGGTEMMSALKAALSRHKEPESNRVRQVIFITDGSVGNEDQLFAFIRENLGDRRLFTVGIGSAPNSHFMSRAATFGRGTFTYVGAAEQVSERMSELFRKLESPVLTHIELDFGVDGVEVWPKRAPDLYLGEPVVVAARLPRQWGDAPAGVDVRGRRGEHPWGVGFQLQGGKTHSGVSKLWARRKIAALMDSMHEGAEGDRARAEVSAEIIEVALHHHLVSKFTSLVAVDVTPTAPQGSPMTKAVPTQLPAGWSYEQTVGALPQGGTAAQLLALLGFLLLIAGLLLHWSGDKSCKDERSVFSSSP